MAVKPEIDPSRVKGIILDCGDVILHAPDHKWWPPPFVESTLTEWGIDFDPDAVANIMRRVSDFLNASHHLHTSTDAENRQFRKYFRYALGELGQENPDDKLIDELVAKQSDPEWYIVYDETMPVLKELRNRGYRLHMLSNSFRFLEGIMQAKGLAEYFDGMTISAFVGCMKPDDRIFQAAINATGLAPEDLLYIDDIESYVQKGMSFGMQGIIMDRFGNAQSDGIASIRNLTDLLNVL